MTDFCTLLRSKHTILRKVTLHGVALGEAGAAELATALAVNQSVEEIDLSGTKMAEDGSSQSALLALAETLALNAKLEIVRVSGWMREKSASHTTLDRSLLCLAFPNTLLGRRQLLDRLRSRSRRNLGLGQVDGKERNCFWPRLYWRLPRGKGVQHSLHDPGE